MKKTTKIKQQQIYPWNITVAYSTNISPPVQKKKKEKELYYNFSHYK